MTIPNDIQPSSESILYGNRRRRVLWFALIGGGVAWFLRFLVIWVISEFGCIGAEPAWATGLGTAVVMMLASVPFIAAAALASVLSYRLMKSHDASRADHTETQRFFAKTGLIVNPIFVVIMLVECLPMFVFLNECRTFSL